MKTVEQRTGTRIYTAYGALVEGDAVCQGYALAYKLLLDKCGIDSVLVTSNEMGHAWNLVKLDGSWYHVDVTWDDPTPNVEGGGTHKNFLRSDEGIGSTGHSGWDAGEISCDGDYINGWWLYQVWFPMYYWEDAFYYVKTWDGIQSFNYRICCTQDLGNEGIQISDYLDNGWSSQNGMVWLDGQLYYTKYGDEGTRVMTRFDLTSCQSAEMGQFSFTAAPSEDGHYKVSVDGVGLEYDRSTGYIRAYSNTRPDTELAAFQVRDYPVDWDRMDKHTTALAGGVLHKENDTLQVGLVWVQPETESAQLLAAFYDEDGRLLKVQMVSSDRWTQGLNVLVLDLEGYPDYDRVTLFLLSDDSVPYCETKNAA